MPVFSAFTGFGFLEFSSKPSAFENIYQSMVNNLGGQYDLTIGGHNEATLFARASSIARAQQTVRRAGNQGQPFKVLELLPLQEAGYGLVPSETDTIATRQTNLSARMLLARGATRENVETQLRAILGSSFVAYRTIAQPEVVAWPPDPSTGPGVFPRIDGVVSTKYVQLLDAVATTGTATAHYSAIDTTQGTTTLTPGDVMTVQLEVLGLAERVTVLTVGTDAIGQFFTASFTKTHDVGASGIVGSVPVWSSNQRLGLILVTSLAAINAEQNRKVDDIMSRVARGVSQWAIVQGTTDGASTMGPFTLGLSPLGAVPLASMPVTPPNALTISSLTPSTGPNAGGTPFVIAGTGFLYATNVTINGFTLGTWSVVNDNTISAITDNVGAPGVQSVVVTSSFGFTASASFTFT